MNKARISAVLEIAGLYMVGQLLGFLLLMALGITLQNPMEVLRKDPHADLLALSWSLALTLTAQYGITFVLIYCVGKVHRRRKLADYGFQPGLGLPAQLLTGLVLFSVADLPGKVMAGWDSLSSWGPKAFTQEFVYAQDWSDFRFWIFLAVGSFVFIPIVEELFFRGYVQTRLAEDFPPLAAIVATAVFFQISHGQYLEAATAWNVGSLVTGLFSALVWGVVFFQTRSLVVTVVAHALVNFPVRGAWDLLLPVAMVALILVCRRQIVLAFRQALSAFREPRSVWPTVVLSLVLAGFAVVVTLAQDFALLFGLVALPVAWLLGRRPRSRQPARDI